MYGLGGEPAGGRRHRPSVSACRPHLPARRRDYDIEPALEQIAAVTVAALLAARCDPWRGLRPRAEELAYALLRLQDTIASRYLGRHLLPAASDPAAADAHPDEVLRRVHARLVDDLGPRFDRPPDGDRFVDEVLSRSLPFLAALRGWSVLGVTRDGPPIGVARPDEPERP